MLLDTFCLITILKFIDITEYPFTYLITLKYCCYDEYITNLLYQTLSVFKVDYDYRKSKHIKYKLSRDVDIHINKEFLKHKEIFDICIILAKSKIRVLEKTTINILVDYFEDVDHCSIYDKKNLLNEYLIKNRVVPLQKTKTKINKLIKIYKLIERINNIIGIYTDKIWDYDTSMYVNQYIFKLCKTSTINLILLDYEDIEHLVDDLRNILIKQNIDINSFDCLYTLLLNEIANYKLIQ